MRFNRLNIISSALILAALTSCEKNDGVLSSMADVTWHLSSDSNNNDPIILNEGGHISMMDASQSELSHRWTLPVGGGLYYYFSDFDNDDNYEDYIDRDHSLSTTDKTIHVYFEKPGQYTINLRNTFPQQVRYPYAHTTEAGKTETRYLYSEEKGGEHVFDYDFKVDVYCKTLVPRVDVYRDAACTDLLVADLDASSTPVDVEIEYGDILYFKDKSYDRPNYWEFICDEVDFKRSLTGSFNAGSVVAIPFKTATKIDGVEVAEPLNVTMRVERKDTFQNSGNGFIPVASLVKETLPLNITVVPTTDDLAFDVVQVDQYTLELQAKNGEFKSDATFSVDDVAKFKLTADNFYSYDESKDPTTANYYFDDVEITIKSIERSTKSNTSLVITLDDRTPIYNTDELYLSCNGEFDDKMEYGMILKFAEPTEPNVKTTFSAIFESDFETEASREGWWASKETPLGYNPSVTYAAVDYDTACANPLPSSVVNPSETCMRANFVDALLDTAENFLIQSPTFAAGKGTYSLTFKYYSPLANSLIPFWSTTSTKFDSATPFADKIFAAYTAQSDWHTATYNIDAKYPADVVNGLNMYLRIVGQKHNVDIYFDDFFFGYVEVRKSDKVDL